ncbi:hypothetical protein BDY19DRAFT_907159 [Irpex rosettiformis]|uniref:Uncharacterized protein n=1 Tax=Irpex rosettiformis TaxID=378272 RepID=A0ACB8U0A2_9APHY|nr:hypothetical protein BDY19DRAFT_907159 [Irpex rosettiformis]
MDTQSRSAIRRLCEKPDLREKAQHLFRSLKAKTGHGSGFELNQRSIALPAISSLLASEELGYNDVTEKLAQAASCLNTKEFTIALATVRKALASAEREKDQFKTTYKSLTARNANQDFMIQCMQDVEAALTLSADLRGPLRPPNDIVTVSVFAWTCKILKLNRDGYVKQHGISEDDYQEVVDALNANCQAVKKDIERKLRALRAERRADTSTTTGTTPTLRKTSSKSALRDVSLSPTKTPAHKRKVAFSPTKAPQANPDDTDVEDTPSKRQKFLSPSKRSTRQSLAAFRDALRGTPSSSKASLAETTDEQEDMDEDSASIPARSELSSSDGDTDIADVEMSDPSASSIADLSMDDTPMTPRRSQRQPKPRSAFDFESTLTPRKSARPESPLKRGKATHRKSYIEQDEVEVIRRRCRPVLLEHKQWLQRDVRADNERKVREQWVRDMIEKCGGHPFESLRGRVVT